MFVYDGGTLPHDAAIRLPAAELRSYRFIDGADLEQVTTTRLARRVRQVLRAREQGCLIEMVNGVRVTGDQKGMQDKPW